MELFYIIAGAESAAARKAALASGKDVRFRNLHYPEVRADFEARGGKVAPALWDGEKLHEGLEAILKALGARQ
ncbi:MAG TPA: hypothetical protein VKE22_16265 [Haliangiales bacterium]|nr:hypothetical protein [Haliangiales bacterium]